MGDEDNLTLLIEPQQSAAAVKPQCTVVGIGASAGGITALKHFFEKMAGDSGMAFVVVVHLSSEHASNLAAILQASTSLTVVEVTETLKIKPNHVYVIPPAKYLAMVDGEVRLTEPEATRGRRVPIDVFLRTLAAAYGRNAICVILSGTGSDGTLGLKRIKEHGGIAIAQDPADAEYDSMPRSAIGTNLVDLVLPAAEIPARLVALKQSGDRILLPEEAHEEENTPAGADPIREVLAMLRIRLGHDFSNYKRPTIGRRIGRRVQVHDLADVNEYVGYLRGHPEEMQALLSDLLITVTNFFRDQDAYEALEQQVVPQLFANKTSAEQVRVWVAGCATGEEAYSIAILLREHAARLADPPKIQIFATDIDADALATARDCRYNETIAADVSPERLRQFFVKEGQNFIVKKELRDSILFAPHNLLRDPPFLRIDLITCRNLLIYLNRNTQDLLLRILHFALRQGDFLFLGASESAEGAASLFAPVDKKNRIYRALPSAARHPPPIPTSNWEIRVPEPPAAHKHQDLSLGNLHHILVEEYAPPSVLVNEEGDIIHLSQHAGRYLQVPGGQPSHNLFDIAPPALQLDLRTAFITAKQENRQIETPNLRVSLNGEQRFVNLIVRPSLPASGATQGLYLVIFDETRPPAAPRDLAFSAQAALEGDKAIETVVRGLEEELQRNKDRLRATIEQHETTVEELKASNEELLAMNEEMRSASEELETGKEELQAVNEELTTVNYELKETIDEVRRANSDLRNLISSTDIATIFLDRGLRVKRYTPRTKEFFNIIATDIGRPLEHLTHKLDYGRLTADLAEVLERLQPIEREVRTSDNHWYMVRVFPYRTEDDHIDGAVLTFVDITERRQMEHARRESEERLSSIVDLALDAIISIDADERIVLFNQAAEKIFRCPAAEALGSPIERFIPARLRAAHAQHVREFDQSGETRRSINRRGAINGLRADGEEFPIEASISRVESGGKKLFTVILRDLTERERAAALQETDRRKDEFLALLSHELRNPLQVLRGVFDIQNRSDNPERMARIWSMAERQADQLHRLVDDLLHVSRISQGKLDLRKQRVSLTSVVNLALESSRPALDQAGHTLTVILPPETVYLDADSARLAQVLTNLLDNAAKYTGPGGRISLNAARNGGQIVIRLRDNGKGIAPEFLPYVFDMFKQAETRRGGLGIGLSLVKQFVEMHGGQVRAHSAGEGQGSEFVVQLPLATDQRSLPPTRAAEPGPTVVAAARGRRILVVDDNIDAAESLAESVRLDGHVARTAYTGETAVETALEFAPDIICLDIDLPDVSGYEVAERLRRELPNSLIVAVSGWLREDVSADRKSTAIDRYFLKPANLENLRTLIAGNNALKA